MAAVRAAKQVSSAAGTNAVFGIPVGTAKGDILYIAVHVRAAVLIKPPEGKGVTWKEVATKQNGANTYSIFEGVWNGEGESWTVGWGGTNLTRSGVILSIKEGNTSAPRGATSVWQINTNIFAIWPGMESEVNEGLRLGFLFETSTGQATPPEGWTEVADQVAGPEIAIQNKAATGNQSEALGSTSTSGSATINIVLNPGPVPANLELFKTSGFSFHTLSIAIPTEVPLGATAGVSSFEAQTTIPQPLAMSPSAGVGSMALGVTAPTQIVPDSLQGSSESTLAITAPTVVPLGPSSGVGSGSLLVSRPESVALGASAGSGSMSLDLQIAGPKDVPLGPSGGVGSASLVLTAPAAVPLNPSSGTSNMSLKVSALNPELLFKEFMLGKLGAEVVDPLQDRSENPIAGPWGNFYTESRGRLIEGDGYVGAAAGIENSTKHVSVNNAIRPVVIGRLGTFAPSTVGQYLEIWMGVGFSKIRHGYQLRATWVGGLNWEFVLTEWNEGVSTKLWTEIRGMANAAGAFGMGLTDSGEILVMLRQELESEWLELFSEGGHSVSGGGVAIGVSSSAIGQPALVDLRIARMPGPAEMPLGASIGGSSFSMALTAPTEVPMDPATGTSSPSVAITAPTTVPLEPVAGIGTTTLDLDVPTIVLLGASTGTSTAELALTAATYVATDPSQGESTTFMEITAPKEVPLAPSVGVGTDALALTAPTALTLSPSTGVATTSLLVSYPKSVNLEAMAGQGTATLGMTAKTEVVLGPSTGLSTAFLSLQKVGGQPVKVYIGGEWQEGSMLLL